MTGVMTFAVELAWWQQTGIRAVVGLLAVLLPAGTLVYLFLFKICLLYTSPSPRDS